MGRLPRAAPLGLRALGDFFFLRALLISLGSQKQSVGNTKNYPIGKRSATSYQQKQGLIKPGR
jgi:hypothetical protein